MREEKYVLCLNSQFSKNRKVAFSVAFIKTANLTDLGIFKTNFQLAFSPKKNYSVSFYMIHFPKFMSFRADSNS